MPGGGDRVVPHRAFRRTTRLGTARACTDHRFRPADRRSSPVVRREHRLRRALAERLELSDGQLAWLADVRGWERSVTDERLRNYRYRSLPRRDRLPRVIEVPKARLKEIQRWVLREILDRVPAHDAAHGFTRGRSAITHAEAHVNQDVVVRLDLRDFFASIAAGRIYGLFSTLGYTPSVARVLTGLTTNVVPSFVWDVIAATTQDRRLVQPRFWLGRALATPHLPQGAPTSPALANLVAFRLDRRLRGIGGVSGAAVLAVCRRPDLLRRDVAPAPADAVPRARRDDRP